MAKVGAPPKYTPEMAKTLHLHAGSEVLGAATPGEIATLLGVAPSTVYEWINKYPEFSEAFAHARKMTDKRVESALFKRALGYAAEVTEQKLDKDGGVHDLKREVHVPGSDNAAIFWLKNRQPGEWADRKVVEVEGSFVDMVEEFVKGKQ